MPSHQQPSKKILLLLVLGTCLLWTKKDLLKQQFPSVFTGNAGFPEFGPLPMTPEFPIFSGIENLTNPVIPPLPNN